MINLYIANLERYNAGYLVGEWIELPAGREAINELLVRIGVAVAKGDDIEVVYDYAIHDYECSIAAMEINEYESPFALDTLAEQIEAIDSLDSDLFTTYVELSGDSVAETIEGRLWENRHFIHIGNSWNVERDAAHAVIDEVYGGLDQLDINNLENHFDMEHFGRELHWDFDRLTEDLYEADKQELQDMSNEDFAQWYIDGLGALKELGRQTLENYFDYDSYGRDVMSEYTYCNETGYIMSDY